MKTQGSGFRTMARCGFGVLAAWFVACAGDDTPPVNNDLRGALATGFGGADTQMGSSGAAGSGGSDSSGGGAGGSGGSGTPVSPGGSGNTPGGGAPAVGSGGSGGGGVACDAFNTILLERCGSVGCHNSTSVQGGFAVSEEGIRGFVNRPSTYTDCPSLFIDTQNPEESLLYTKVTGDFPNGCGNLGMPLSGDPLDDAEEACLLEWLSQF